MYKIFINKIKSRGWTRKTVIRYILLQIPSFLLLLLVLYLVKEPFHLPFWSIFLIASLWILKDFVMFFFVWRAYIPSGGGDSSNMVGRTGIARDTLNPSGYVQIGGELWYAELKYKNNLIVSGQPVIVRESHGLTLFVEIHENH